MSSVRAVLSGDTHALMQRLSRLSNLNITGTLNSIAEGLRTSTIERFTTQQTPEGKSWKTSIRAREEGGKTLIKTNQLRTSIRTEVNQKGLAVGTNDIRAATLQFGRQWKRVASVTINIPPRPFLGISEEDEKDIQDTLKSILK